MLLKFFRRIYFWIISLRKSSVHYIGGNESLPKPLTREEEREMLLAFMDGDEYARDVLIVITVDGKTFPAPFTIEAVGDPEVLLASVNLGGGVVDQLTSDNIIVTVEEKGRITMPAM